MHPWTPFSRRDTHSLTLSQWQVFELNIGQSFWLCGGKKVMCFLLPFACLMDGLRRELPPWINYSITRSNSSSHNRGSLVETEAVKARRWAASPELKCAKEQVAPQQRSRTSRVYIQTFPFHFVCVSNNVCPSWQEDQLGVESIKTIFFTHMLPK